MPELAADAEAEIRRHGTETYPNECCGALIASGDDDRRGLPAAEHHRRRAAAPVPDRPGRLPARRGARPGARRDARRLLPFASRSSGPPVGNDLAQAWPNLTYMIVAVRDGQPEDLRFWRLRDDRSGFEEI